MRAGSCLALCSLLFVSTGCGSGGTPVTGEVVNNPGKIRPGERWSITLIGGDGKSYNGDTNDSGTFTIDKVPSGTYSVKVMHYVPADVGEGKKVDAAALKAATARPVEKEYPDSWAVPGGPYKLDLMKLPKDKK